MAVIYLDYNATTPIAPEVAAAMEPFLRGGFANPSSGHALGREVRRAVEAARARVAELLGAAPGEIVFTSGGTESNNMAILGAAWARRDRGRHVVTSAVEHPAVGGVCRRLAGEGWSVTVLPVDGHGLVDPADLEAALTPETVLVTVMHANNEVGTLEPVRELAEIARRVGALVHTDAAQSLGKVPVTVDELGVDLLSVAGHKLYGPKGVGALYVRSGVELAPLMHGAGQEGGRRPGTENVLEIVGLGEACRLAGERLAGDAPRLRGVRDRLYGALERELGPEALRVNGHPQQRLPNTLSVSFRGVDGKALLAELGDEVAASAGAACHGGGAAGSAVLTAMGVAPEWGVGTVRFSVGRSTGEEDVARAASAVARAVRRLWKVRHPAPAGS